jgi:hypothetical protein
VSKKQSFRRPYLTLSLGALPYTIFGSATFFNILTDKAGTIVDTYIQNVRQKQQIFKNTLDYLPNGVLLIDIKMRSISF